MKYLMFLPFLVVVLMFGCKKDEPTPKEQILGVWVGVENPELDTMIFYGNDSIRFSWWGVDSYARFYTIDDKRIWMFDPFTSISSSHSYEFRGNDMVYIRGLGFTTWLDDGGIEFQKQ